jgi:hypothetical protein
MADEIEPVREFISEDNLKTFEGWLKLQGCNAATLTPEALAQLREAFAEVQKASAATPKVGLMKLRPGLHRYAVAIRDSSGLWLTLWVKRSLKGDIYVLWPRGDARWNPHTSYHRDGKWHQKSYGKKFLVRQRQPLNASFRGTENVGVFAGHGGKSIGAICDSTHFSGVVELGPGILGPVHGNVAVDLVEPGCEPMDLMLRDHKEVAHQEFRDAVPYVVIRVFASE